jgi:DNA-directed RNA polymerase subunit RPC12/RpoP
MILKCRNCRHIWEYRGKSKWYATCPRCKWKVRVKEEPIKASRKHV